LGLQWAAVRDLLRAWSQQFREQRLQGVRPHLVTLNVQMQPITTGHAFEQLAILVCQPVVMFKYLTFLPSANFAMLSLIWLMIDITARLSLRGVIPIKTIVALGAFLRQTSIMALSPRVMSAIRGSSPASADRYRHCGSSHDDDDFRIDVIEFSVVEPPENILRCVSAPTEVGRIPAKKFSRQFARNNLYCSSLVPHRRVIESPSNKYQCRPCLPCRATGHGPAESSDPNGATAGQQLARRRLSIWLCVPTIAPGPLACCAANPVGGTRLIGPGARCFDKLAGPLAERRPILGDAVTAVVLSPGELSADQLTHRGMGSVK